MNSGGAAHPSIPPTKKTSWLPPAYDPGIAAIIVLEVDDIRDGQRLMRHQRLSWRASRSNRALSIILAGTSRLNADGAVPRCFVITLALRLLSFSFPANFTSFSCQSAAINEAHIPF
jgi:hypothetical protein